MALPVRSKARVKFYPPTALYQTRKGGHAYAHTYWFAELTRHQLPRTMADPPSPETRFWRGSTVTGLSPIPELRGAIMTPGRVPWLSKLLTPYGSDAAPCGWNDALHPASPWFLAWQENLGRFVATTTNTTRAYVTTPVLAEGQSIYIRYALMAPEATGGTVDDVETRPRSGMRVHFNGYVSAGEFHSTYGLNCPMPHPDYDEDSVWTVKSDGVVLDSQAGSGRHSTDKGVTELQWEVLEILSIAGKLVIRTGDADSGWVISARDWSTSIPAGPVAVEFYGCRAFVELGQVGYSGAATVASPSILTPAWAAWHDTQAGYYDRLGMHGGSTAAVSGIWSIDGPREGHIGFTLTNTSPTLSTSAHLHATTPLLTYCQVVHAPTPTAEVASVIDVSAHVTEVEYTVSASGRGHTATVTLDTTSFDPSGLVGMGLMTIELAHQYGTEPDPEWTPDPDWAGPGEEVQPQVEIPDSAWQTVFTGYIRRHTAEVRATRKTVTFDLCDRAAAMWQGRPKAMHMPYFGGMPFAAAVAFALEHGQTKVSTGEGVIGGAGTALAFGDYDFASAVTVPEQVGTATAAMDPQMDLLAVLDRLCSLCWHRWYIAPDGTVHVDPAPSMAGATVYTLTDDDDVEEVGKLLDVVQSPADFADAATVTYVIGRDALGMQRALWADDADAITNTASPRYVGWELWQTYVEEDNAAPERLMARTWNKARNRGKGTNLSIVGRLIPALSVVENQVAGLMMPVGARFLVTGVQGRLSSDDGLPLWREDYETEILEGVTIGW